MKKPKRGSSSVSKFCGWGTLASLVKKAPSVKVGALIATLFETGCRISELLQLKADQFEIEDGWIMVYGAPVLKKGKASEAEKRRNIPIPRTEPLVSVMTDFVEKSKTKKLFSKSRIWAWRKIKETDPGWWPHRLRTERATQLVVEYGFNVPKLMRWFNWSTLKTPTSYVRLSVEDLKNSMRKRR